MSGQTFDFEILQGFSDLGNNGYKIKEWTISGCPFRVKQILMISFTIFLFDESNVTLFEESIIFYI